MHTEHIVVMEPVRAYLLGKLNEAACASIEEKYFTSPACLARIEEIEAGLIADYLDDRLNGSDRARFEQRYLTIPVLLQKVVEARSGKLTRRSPRHAFTMGWRLVFAALVVISAIAVWSYVRGTSRANPQLAQITRPEALPTLALALSPGLAKGSEMPASLSLPASGAHVRLVLELPGRVEPLDCVVRLILPGATGRSDGKAIDLGKFRSEAAPGGQHLPVPLQAALLTAADYLVEVADTEGHTLETYSFRVKFH